MIKSECIFAKILVAACFLLPRYGAEEEMLQYL